MRLRSGQKPLGRRFQRQERFDLAAQLPIVPADGAQERRPRLGRSLEGLVQQCQDLNPAAGLHRVVLTKKEWRNSTTADLGEGVALDGSRRDL